jgi:hypothetical protein
MSYCSTCALGSDLNPLPPFLACSCATRCLMPSWTPAWPRTPSPRSPARPPPRPTWCAAPCMRHTVLGRCSSHGWHRPSAALRGLPPTAAARAALLVQVMVFGEITTRAKVDYEAIVRQTCRNIGFTSDDVGLDADKCKVLVHLEEQSPDIGQGVHGMGTKTLEEIGAGDQVQQPRPLLARPQAAAACQALLLAPSACLGHPASPRPAPPIPLLDPGPHVWLCHRRDPGADAPDPRAGHPAGLQAHRGAQERRVRLAAARRQDPGDCGVQEGRRRRGGAAARAHHPHLHPALA